MAPIRISMLTRVVLVAVFVAESALGQERFSQAEYKFSVTENAIFGTRIGRVYLVDSGNSEISVSSVVYRLTPSNGLIKSLNLFSVDSKTGSVTTVGKLDREQLAHHQYQLRAQYIRHGETQSVPVFCKMTVSIMDVNDNAPQFDDVSSVVRISEGYKPGNFLTQLIAIDRDAGKNGNVSYSLLQSGMPFSIKSDGSIVVTGNIDREHRHQYIITVRASDHGDTVLHTDHVLTVKILDVNDNTPVFSQRKYSADLDEGQDAGSPVIQLSANDRDGVQYGKVLYSITSGNSAGLFSIDTNSGMVRTTAVLDADVVGGSTFTLNVRAEDIAGLYDSAAVKVVVNNLNDHSPVFLPDTKTSVQVSESRRAGLSIMHVIARDRDLGSFGRVVYDLPDAKIRSVFAINPTTGELKLAKTLDYETQRGYSIKVRARDGGVPPRIALIHINVSVINAFDNEPAFTQSSYTTSLPENAMPGSEVVSVSARDPDGLKVTYSLISGNDQGHFLIDDAGSIRIANGLDFDKPDGKVYNLIVRAADGTSTKQAPVTVTVLDVNDHTPKFERGLYELTVSEDERVGWNQLTARASDGDSGNNSLLTYRMDSNDTTLTIDGRTGQVYIAATPDCDNGKGVLHKYTVWAIDSGTPSLKGKTELKLTISDRNDNAPVFDRGLLRGSVYENVDRQSTVMTVSATDQDYAPINSQVRYHIAPSSGQAFSINAVSGIIRTRVALDRESQNEYRLVIHATDSGSPPLSSQAEVVITIKDIPDSPPVFVNTDQTPHLPGLATCYQSYIIENKPVGTSIFTVQASSPDSSVQQSSLRYSIQSHHELFHINASTGLITNRKVMDRDHGTKSYRLTVRATTFDTFADCDVVVAVRDVNDNPPMVRNTDVFANLLQSSFRGGVVGNVHLIDPDVSVVVQRALSSPGFDSGFFTLLPDGSIIASEDTLPGIYKLRTSADDLHANHSRAEGTTTVHIRWVTSASLDNVVSMQLAGAGSVANFVQHFYLRTVSAMATILQVKKENVELFSVQKSSDDDGVLDVVFAVRLKSGIYLNRSVVIEDIDHQQEIFHQYSGLHMISINLDKCRMEPCKYFQDCVDSLRFSGYNNTILAGNISFTSLIYTQSYSCSCPPGYLHDWHSESCRIEVDECASSPCLYGGTCHDALAGYTCTCLNGTTGKNCETFCPSSQCNFCQPNPCLHGSRCTVNAAGTTQCQCDDGYDGPLCEQTTASFTAGEFLAFPSITSRWDLDLALSFATARRNGLLLYNGRLGTQYDVLALEIVDGRVYCHVSLDGVAVKLVTENTRLLSDGKWHTITVRLVNQHITLKVDNCHHENPSHSIFEDFVCKVTHNITAGEDDAGHWSPTGRSLDLGGPIYIGGVRSTFNYETITTRHFDGCIRNVKINQDVLDLSAAVSQSKGVVLGTCPALADFCHKTTCLNGVCQNVWNGSYCACTKSHGGRFCETIDVVKAKLTGQSQIQYHLSKPFFRGRRGLTFRSRGLYGTLWYTDHSQLQIIKGQLKYTFHTGQQNYSVDLAGVQVDDGLWHQVEVNMDDGKSTKLSLDYGQYVATVSQVESQTTSNFLIGALPLLRNGKDLNSTFKGCIHSLHINDNVLPISSTTPNNITLVSSLPGQPIWSLVTPTPHNVLKGCLSTAVCATRPCPTSGVCYDEWEQHRCECLPFRRGRGCIDVCAAVGDEEIPRCGKGVCLHDSTQPHGYNCDCSSSFPYGKGPEGVCDMVFPGSLKSYCSPGFYNYPHCTPCRCDWSGTDTGICSLTNGTCLCKENTFSPAGQKSCQLCSCDHLGSVSSHCNVMNGQCTCKPFVTGRRCDHCMDGYAGLDESGCHKLTTVRASLAVQGPSSSDSLQDVSIMSHSRLAHAIKSFFVGVAGEQTVTISSIQLVTGSNESARLQVNFLVEAFSYDNVRNPSHNDIVASLSQGVLYGTIGHFRVIAGSFKADVNCSDSPCFPGVACVRWKGATCGACPSQHTGNGYICVNTKAIGCTASLLFDDNVDSDFDGIVDACDNCPWIFNPGQDELCTIQLITELCPAGREDLADGTRISWAAGTVGRKQTLPCPAGSVGNMTRSCSLSGWESSSLLECQSLSVAALAEEFKSLQSGRILSIEEAMDWERRLLATTKSSPICNESRVIYAGDVLAVQSMLTGLLQYGTSLMHSNIQTLEKEFVSTAFELSSCLLSKSHMEVWKATETSNTSTVVNTLLTLSTFLQARAAVSTAQPNVLQSHSFGNVYAEYFRSSSNAMRFPGSNSSSKILDHATVYTTGGSVDATFLHLRDAGSLMPSVLNSRSALNGDVWLINSAVVDITVKARNKISLKPTVALHLRHFSSSGMSVCAYWDHAAHSWSTSGCSVALRNSTHTVCSCNHLTAFALLKPDDSHSKGLPLNWLAAVSCAVSLAIFLILLLLVVSYRKRTYKELVVGYVNSCIPAIILELVFLVSLFASHYPTQSCTILTAILQYAIMALVCNLFLLEVRMLEFSVTRKTKDNMRSAVVKTILAGWLIPAAIPVICLTVLYPGQLGGSAICWMKYSTGVAFWIFYLPAACVIVVTVLLVLVNVIWKRTTDVVRLKKATTGHLVWLLCFSLGCGCIWLILPYFMVEYNSKIAVVVFAVANVIWCFSLVPAFVRMHKRTKLYEVPDVQTETALAKLTSSQLNPNHPASSTPGQSFSIDGTGSRNSSLSRSLRKGAGTVDGLQRSAELLEIQAAEGHRLEYLSPYSATAPGVELYNAPQPPPPPQLQDFFGEDPRLPSDTVGHGGRSHHKRNRHHTKNHARPARQPYRGDYEPMVFKTLAVLDSQSSSTPTIEQSDGSRVKGLSAISRLSGTPSSSGFGTRVQVDHQQETAPPDKGKESGNESQSAACAHFMVPSDRESRSKARATSVTESASETDRRPKSSPRERHRKVPKGDFLPSGHARMHRQDSGAESSSPGYSKSKPRFLGDDGSVSSHPSSYTSSASRSSSDTDSDCSRSSRSYDSNHSTSPSPSPRGNLNANFIPGNILANSAATARNLADLAEVECPHDSIQSLEPSHSSLQAHEISDSDEITLRDIPDSGRLTPPLPNRPAPCLEGFSDEEDEDLFHMPQDGADDNNGAHGDRGPRDYNEFDDTEEVANSDDVNQYYPLDSPLYSPMQQETRNQMILDSTGILSPIHEAPSEYSVSLHGNENTAMCMSSSASLASAGKQTGIASSPHMAGTSTTGVGNEGVNGALRVPEDFSETAAVAEDFHESGTPQSQSPTNKMAADAISSRCLFNMLSPRAGMVNTDAVQVGSSAAPSDSIPVVAPCDHSSVSSVDESEDPKPESAVSLQLNVPIEEQCATSATTAPANAENALSNPNDDMASS